MTGHCHRRSRMDTATGLSHCDIPARPRIPKPVIGSWGHVIRFEGPRLLSRRGQTMFSSTSWLHKKSRNAHAHTHQPPRREPESKQRTRSNFPDREPPTTNRPTQRALRRGDRRIVGRLRVGKRLGNTSNERLSNKLDTMLVERRKFVPDRVALDWSFRVGFGARESRNPVRSKCCEA